MIRLEVGGLMVNVGWAKVFLVVAPSINWKGCRLSWTALPYARLKESEWFHPQEVPSLWRMVAKILEKNLTLLLGC